MNSTMKVKRHVAEVGPSERPRIVTLGSFDGVHRGHQRVLARLAKRAAERGGEAVAVTFYPQKRTAASSSAAPLLLTRLRQRLELLAASGVTFAVLQPFTQRFATLDEERLIREVVRRLNARVLVLGERVALGKGRVAAAAHPSAPDATSGLVVEVVPPVRVNGQTITSRAIRTALARGDLSDAERMLGRSYSVSGRVVHGHHRGRPLGIPTANLRLRGVQLPPDGVYAVRARIGGTMLQGVANIGVKPTFGDRERSVETHLLDFEQDLYGQRLEVIFLECLRGERKFPDAGALVDQIRRDIAVARRLFAGG